jgi:hypothetical protein
MIRRRSSYLRVGKSQTVYDRARVINNQSWFYIYNLAEKLATRGGEHARAGRQPPQRQRRRRTKTWRDAMRSAARQKLFFFFCPPWRHGVRLPSGVGVEAFFFFRRREAPNQPTACHGTYFRANPWAFCTSFGERSPDDLGHLDLIIRRLRCRRACVRARATPPQSAGLQGSGVAGRGRSAFTSSHAQGLRGRGTLISFIPTTPGNWHEAARAARGQQCC